MKIPVDVKAPMLPNFLRMQVGEESLPVLDVRFLTDEQAKDLWRAWEKEWLDHVHKRRTGQTL
jgi:hypothetical protein